MLARVRTFYLVLAFGPACGACIAQGSRAHMREQIRSIVATKISGSGEHGEGRCNEGPSNEVLLDPSKTPLSAY